MGTRSVVPTVLLAAILGASRPAAAQSASGSWSVGGSVEASRFSDEDAPNRIYTGALSTITRWPIGGSGSDWSLAVRSDLAAGQNSGLRLLSFDVVPSVEYRRGDWSAFAGIGTGYHDWESNLGCSCSDHETTTPWISSIGVGLRLGTESELLFDVRSTGHEEVRMTDREGYPSIDDLGHLGLRIAWLRRIPR